VEVNAMERQYFADQDQVPTKGSKSEKTPPQVSISMSVERVSLLSQAKYLLNERYYLFIIYLFVDFVLYFNVIFIVNKLWTRMKSVHQDLDQSINFNNASPKANPNNM